MTERLLPHSPDAERAVLGAIILDNTTYDQAAMALQPQDFGMDSHRRIFARMMELALEAKPIDFVTLTESGLGQYVGGSIYIMGLTDGLPRVKNIEHYVRIVKDRAMLRQVIHVCNGGVNAAFEIEAPATHILGTLQDQFLELQGNTSKDPAVRPKEFSDETLRRLIELRNSTKYLIGLTTGVKSWDRRTTGIREGELWCIGGRTSDGKTALALQIAAMNAAQGIAVGYFSVEMRRHSLLERLWSAEGSVDFSRIRNPRLLNDADCMALAKAKESVDTWPLYIEDAASYTISEIEARSRLMIRQHKVKLIAVDHVHIVSSPGKDERQQVTRISKGLRTLAKDQGVPVLALCQTPRPAEHNLNKRPTKFDLKESGSLENDADTVAFIFRPVDQYNQPVGEDELITAKQRNGAIGIDPVVLLGKYQRFEERVI